MIGLTPLELRQRLKTIVLDTHAWLWWLQGNNHELPNGVRQTIDSAESVSVSALSCLEVAWLEKKRRIALPVPLSQFLEGALAASGIALLPLTPAIAARSVHLPDIHGDPIDRIIIATAIEYDADVVSRDRMFSRYPEVRVLWG